MAKRSGPPRTALYKLTPAEIKAEARPLKEIIALWALAGVVVAGGVVRVDEIMDARHAREQAAIGAASQLATKMVQEVTAELGAPVVEPEGSAWLLNPNFRMNVQDSSPGEATTGASGHTLSSQLPVFTLQLETTKGQVEGELPDGWFDPAYSLRSEAKEYTLRGLFSDMAPPGTYTADVISYGEVDIDRSDSGDERYTQVVAKQREGRITFAINGEGPIRVLSFEPASSDSPVELRTEVNSLLEPASNPYYW